MDCKKVPDSSNETIQKNNKQLTIDTSWRININQTKYKIEHEVPNLFYACIVLSYLAYSDTDMFKNTFMKVKNVLNNRLFPINVNLQDKIQVNEQDNTIEKIEFDTIDEDTHLEFNDLLMNVRKDGSDKGGDEFNIKSFDHDKHHGIYIIHGSPVSDSMVFIVFRGTYETSDIMRYGISSKAFSDKTLSDDDHMKGNIGMYDMVHNNYKDMIQHLKQIPNIKEKTICSTGHSLGGALSTMFVRQISRDLRHGTDELKPDDFNNRLINITVASPRPYRQESNDIICNETDAHLITEKIPYNPEKPIIIFRRIFNECDIIPNVPPKDSKDKLGTIGKILHKTGFKHVCEGNTKSEAIVNYIVTNKDYKSYQDDQLPKANSKDFSGNTKLHPRTGMLPHLRHIGIPFIVEATDRLRDEKKVLPQGGARKKSSKRDKSTHKNKNKKNKTKKQKNKHKRRI